ncbi:Uncharacterised protein [Pseudomonas putida]|nr:Uncharacterised protein [Pseudomonas putida]
MLRRRRYKEHNPLTKRQHPLWILSSTSGAAKPPAAPSTEPFFVIGFAPEKNCPGAARCRKILQTTWHKAYSEYPPFTHKVRTRYPQALALQSPQYRIILYPERSEPLHIGVRAKSHTKVNPQNQAIFRAELQVISAAKPLLRRRPRQALSGRCSGMSVAGNAWHSSAPVFGMYPEPLTSARERQAIAPYS